MHAKLLTLILFATVVGATLLHMRQQRFETMHDMATLHRQMDRRRQSMWKLQSQIADAADPSALLGAVERTKLALEPVAPRRPGVVLAKASDD